MPTRSPAGNDCNMLLTIKDCHMEIPGRTPNCYDKIGVVKRLLAKTFGGIMRNPFSKTVILFAATIVILAGIAVAQAPVPAPASASSAVENPTYVTIEIETDVKKP